MKDFAPRTPAAKVATPAPGKGRTLVDNRATAVAQRQLLAAIATSPRQVAQRQQAPVPLAAPRPNRTGLPDRLKTGVESLSGHSLDDVKVHYNSAKPAQLQAHAYAQGTDIHLGPGQEKHLPHEAWHVVQQKQRRVRATRQLKSKALVNDNYALEREADTMGVRALNNLQGITPSETISEQGKGNSLLPRKTSSLPSIQLKRAVPEGEWDDYAKKEGDEGTEADASKDYDNSKARGDKFKDSINEWKIATAAFWSGSYTKENRKAAKAITFNMNGKQVPVGKTGTGKDLEAANYKTTAVGEGEGYKIATQRGEEAPAEDKVKGEYEYDYHNNYNPVKKQFVAAWNMSDSDKGRAPAEQLPASNSEIIWRQYKDALKKSGEGKESKVGNFQSIKRSLIINSVTKHTFFFSDKWASLKDGVTLHTDEPDLWTFLGTPNGTAAAYLLLQHGLSMGAKDIKDIKTNGTDMEISYDLKK